jgi:hypothetical protein
MPVSISSRPKACTRGSTLAPTPSGKVGLGDRVGERPGSATARLHEHRQERAVPEPGDLQMDGVLGRVHVAR